MSSETNSDVHSLPRYRRTKDKQNKQNQHYKSKDILETSGYSRPVTHSSVYDEIYDIHPPIHHSETDSDVTGNLHPLTPYSSINDRQDQHYKSSDFTETSGHSRRDTPKYHVYHTLPPIYHYHSDKKETDGGYRKGSPVSYPVVIHDPSDRHSHEKLPLPDTEVANRMKYKGLRKRLRFKKLSDSHDTDDYLYPQHNENNRVPYEYSENKTYFPSEEPDYANISDVSNLPPLPPPLPPRNKAPIRPISISTPKSTTEEHVYVNIPNPILSYPSFTRPMKFFNFSDDDFIHYRSHSPLKNLHLKRQNWPDTPRDLLLSKSYTKRQDTKGANSGTSKRIQGKYCGG